MAKYKRRSINTTGLDNQYVEAAQFDPHHVRGGYVETIHGRIWCQSGDWVITYDNGVRKVMRDEVFKLFFELVHEKEEER